MNHKLIGFCWLLILGLAASSAFTQTKTYTGTINDDGASSLQEPKGAQVPSGASTIGVNLTPSTTQTVMQPSGTSLNVSSLNNVVNAALYPGKDIGAKVSNAIAVIIAAYGGGIVEIPAGTYSFSTPIVVPQRIALIGHNEATRLKWTGSAAAIILANSCTPYPNCAAGGEDTHGYLADITLTGTNSVGQIGVYQGGDPAGVITPSTYIGFNYDMRNVNISHMDKGIYWGNYAFNISWLNVESTNNLTYGWYYPNTSTSGGQNNHFIHCHLGGNPSGAFLVQQLPEVTFSMHGMDIEYNGRLSGPGGPAQMQGGNYQCFDCHVESYYGPLISVGSNNGSASFYGGFFTVTAPKGTDSYLINLATGRSTLAMDSVGIQINHLVTTLITQATGNNQPQIYFRNNSLIDLGGYLGTVTNVTGHGVYWCLPFKSAGTGSGSCYDGNVYINPVGTISNNLNPASLPSYGTYMGWNGDGSTGGSDFYNTFNSAHSTNYAFRWNANNKGTFTPLASILRNGTMDSVNGFSVAGTAGVTGNLTAGACVLHFQGGILTSTTGKC